MPFPNPDTQFKPGKSGNPNGRPRGSRPLSYYIQEMMDDPDFVLLLPDPKEGFKEQKGRPAEAIIKVAIVRASQGEKESREWLAKYGYGTKVQLSNDPENPIGNKTQELTDEELNGRIEEYIKRRGTD